MTDGIQVARTGDIPKGEGIAISRSITGTEDNIAVFHDTDDTFWALNDTCTHEVASLADGWVEEGYVECPIHASRFCLRNGKVASLPATRDTVCHKVEVRDGEIWLFPNVAPDA